MAMALDVCQMAQNNMKVSGLATSSMAMASSIIGMEQQLGTMENGKKIGNMDKAHTQKEMAKSLVVYGRWTY